jgi:hypothetical protein
MKSLHFYVQFPFGERQIIASSVENMWFCTERNKMKPHLSGALWLGCGAKGIKVSLR